MWYIKIEGRRGYLNGITIKGARNPTHTIEFNNDPSHKKYFPDVTDGIEVRYSERNEEHRFVMKINNNEIKSAFAFFTKDEAEEYLKTFKQGWVDFELDKVREYTYKPYSYKSHSSHPEKYNYYVTHRNIDTITASLDKLSIVELSDAIAPKRTLNIGAIKSTRYSKCYGDIPCDVCRITMSKDEPFVCLNNTYICTNCAHTLAESLTREFNAHPNSEAWKEAWNLEMMMRD